MRFCPKRMVWLVALLVLLASASRAELGAWIEHLDNQSGLAGLFFKAVALPGGPIQSRRVPKETIADLTKLIRTAPKPELFQLRAHEDELALDIAAAEADWKQYAESAPAQPGPSIQLANFYHRQVRPAEELASLQKARQLPPAGAERYVPDEQTLAWQLYQRAIDLVAAQSLPVETGIEQYRAWIAQFPKNQRLYGLLLNYLLQNKKYKDADSLVTQYRAAFPDSEEFALTAAASIARVQGSDEQAIALYDRSFQPDWPAGLVKNYFELLKSTHGLRRFLANARAAQAKDPMDLAAAARVFYYYQQQGNSEQAHRALAEYRRTRNAAATPWAGGDLVKLAKLFEDVHYYDEAADSYYRAYTLAAASPEEKRRGLGGAIRVLLDAPQEAIHLGSGDLTYYKDIGSMDPYPGSANGILSLLYNSADVPGRFAGQQQAAIAYFHRAKAAELLAILGKTYGKSPEAPDLHARLIDAYGAYGDNDGLIQAGRQFLTEYAQSKKRVHVALAVADAYARKKQNKEEFAIYDSLLKELAAAAGGVPLGAAARSAYVQPEAENAGESDETAPASSTPPQDEPSAGTGARSPEYAQVLDRYLARLIAQKQTKAVLALYRNEIGRNSNDPGLYDRFARYLEQNKLAADLEQTYQKAAQQFPDRSWYHKLARWYLRNKQTGQLGQLSRTVVGIFSGTELEQYFSEIVGQKAVDAVLYRQLNLAAHARFPNDLVFVRNLLVAFTRTGTADPVAWENLLRSYWCYDRGLQAQFFEFLSRTNKLDAEVRALESLPAAVKNERIVLQFASEARVWQSHFEESAQPMLADANQFPGDREMAVRTSSLYRSLSAFVPQDVEVAMNIQERLLKLEPAGTEPLTRLGEIAADQEDFKRARSYWDRIPLASPGTADAYLDTATVFWDYFQYDDALRVIAEARRKLPVTTAPSASSDDIATAGRRHPKFAQAADQPGGPPSGGPALFAYEAGAIYENQRNYPQAITEYLKGALANPQGSREQERLVVLAGRSGTKELVDRATAQQVTNANPSLSGLLLRTAVLENQNRLSDLEHLLELVAAKTNSLDILSQVDVVAAKYGFNKLREESLQRQIALIDDPQDQLRLRIELAKFYEGTGDQKSAQKTLDAVYKDASKLVGVVRAKTDYEWRVHDSKRALETLEKAASESNVYYKRTFLLEAARKATEVEDYVRARRDLTPLLSNEPLSSDLVAAMADTYARENDDTNLRAFYTGRLQQVASSPLSPSEKIAKAAELRQGLIPVLTRLKDFTGATQQYLEVMNRFPDDAALAADAALYAKRNGTTGQLRAFYRKAIQDSPKDARWPIILAHLETGFEDLPAAVDAYSKAALLRPERTDLLDQKASMEQRLLRFDDAYTTYVKLYELSYHQPAFMVHAAEVRARQGRVDDAEKALRTAFLDGHTAAQQDYFEVAKKLDSWNELDRARKFADQGLKLIKAGDSDSAGSLYFSVQLAARQRNYEGAYNAAVRVYPAGAASYLQAIAGVAKMYYTPEEKQTLGAFLEKVQIQPAPNAGGVRGTGLFDAGRLAAQTTFSAPNGVAFTVFRMRTPGGDPDGKQAAEIAGLYEVAARLGQKAAMRAPSGETRSALEDNLKLQSRRLKFAEAAAEAEAFAKAMPQDDASRDQVLLSAAGLYHAGGMKVPETRVLASLDQRNALPPAAKSRYISLLLASNADRLVVLSRNGQDEARNQAAEATLMSTNFDLALRAVAARGVGLPPVWTKAYTGLTGLYFGRVRQDVQEAFQGALGSPNIREQVTKRAGRQEQLVGDLWFYYGSRYGSYLGLAKSVEAEDYLPAEAEGRPASADSYFHLAEYYKERSEPSKALEEYQHTLQFDPIRADVQDRMAVILWQQDRKADAIARWKLALENLAAIQNGSRQMPESFWNAFESVLTNIGTHKVFPDLKTETEVVVRTYIQRNGSYRIESLGRAIASADYNAGVRWLAGLSRFAGDPIQFLGNLVDQSWVTLADREVLYQRLLSEANKKAAESGGEMRAQALGSARGYRLKYVQWLLDSRQFKQARASLQQLDSGMRKEMASQILPLEIRAAAGTNTLTALLDRYGGDADNASLADWLREAAASLKSHGEDSAARDVLEVVYAQDLSFQKLTTANFLGLAEVKLEKGELQEALDLLGRMNLIVGEPFQNIDGSAGLLERTGHPKEALQFREVLQKAEPWNGGNVAMLNIDRGEANSSAALIARTDIPYAVRVQTATWIGEHQGSAGAGSGELALLAAPSGLTPAAAEKPLYYHARMAAAGKASGEVRMRLLRGALEIDPAAEVPRLSLFREAMAAGQFQLALSTLQPALEPTSLRNFFDLTGTDQDEGSYSASNPGDFLPAYRLTPHEKAEVARQVSTAFQKLNSMQAARASLGIASGLEASPEVDRAIRNIEALQKLRRENGQRRPVISAGLQQPSIVRPRLAALESGQ